MSNLAVEREHRVSPIELFFHLMFVFALTEVTTLWVEQAALGRARSGVAGAGRSVVGLGELCVADECR